MWAGWIHHHSRLGGPQIGDKIRKGPHVNGSTTSPLPTAGSPTRGQNQKGTTCERMGYITPTVCGVPNTATKSERYHMWADW